MGEWVSGPAGERCEWRRAAGPVRERKWVMKRLSMSATRLDASARFSVEPTGVGRG